jgi:hypothetical protein
MISETADDDAGPQGEPGTGQPEQGDQPDVAPPPAGDQAEQAQGGQHHAVRRERETGGGGVVVDRSQALQPEEADSRRGREYPPQRGAGIPVVIRQGRLRHGRLAGHRLLNHADDLRAGDYRSHHPSEGHHAQLDPGGDPAVTRAADQPEQQHCGSQAPGQDGRFLVNQQRGAEDHAQDGRLPPAWPTGQPYRRLQRQGQENRAQRELDLIPGVPRHHRGQAEERTRRDRPGLRGHPQPGRPVHRVTHQPRRGHRQQVVAETGAIGERDRGHQHTRQRHQHVKPQRGPHRRGQVVGEPGITGMQHQACHPPVVPDKQSAVPAGRDHMVNQVSGPGPVHRDTGGQIGGQDHEMHGHRPGGPAQLRWPRPRPGVRIFPVRRP